MAETTLPANLARHPRLRDWIRLDADGTVTVTPGKVEIGQGILTALRQIVADELDVAPSRIVLRPAATDASPNEGVTSGSLSVQDSGAALGQAAADLRALLADAAAARLGVGCDALTIEDGTIRGPGNAAISYWELADAVPPDAEAQGRPRKPVAARRLIGHPAPRLDIPGRVFGTRGYLHDRTPDGLLHGRMLRADMALARLESVDEAAARGVPGVVAVVRDGSFLGVVAETEAAAEQGRASLARSARWTQTGTLPDDARLPDWLAAAPSQPVEIAASGTLPETGQTLRRSYSRPYIAHASIAPSAAIVLWDGDTLRVWTHSQGVFNLRADLAIVLNLDPERIVVQHAEGAGCYGHNGADDAALDAALLARAVPGRPVRLQYTRREEMADMPFGAAMRVDLEATLDARGRIAGWHHTIFSNGHVARPGRNATPTLRAASEIAEGWPRFVASDPPQSTGGGADRNSIPLYDIPAQRIMMNRLTEMPLRTSSLRSLGAFANVFAIESFVDELAALAGADPLRFRLDHLSDPRARAVLEAVAERGGWGGPKADGIGRGLGVARYKSRGAWCAVLAEVEADEAVRARRLTVAVDVGAVVNPDGVRNQIEGGAVQAASWALKEAVRFDRDRVLSDDWESYPILRFSEVPAVEVILIDRPDAPPLGAGEAAHGPVAGALGNAVADALGVRVRDLPLSRDALIKAMELS